MKRNKDMANLIYELEYIIGGACYNPNSYDGYTMEEGCAFRYPVTYYLPEYENLTKTRRKISGLPFKHMDTIKYVFGSNHLFIGEALVDVLEYLEERYDLDFNELEKQYKANLKKDKTKN